RAAGMGGSHVCKAVAVPGKIRGQRVAGKQQSLFSLQMHVCLGNSSGSSGISDAGCIPDAPLPGSELHGTGPSIFPPGATTKSEKSRKTQVEEAEAHEPGDCVYASGEST